jgi:hypothetical protein
MPPVDEILKYLLYVAGTAAACGVAWTQFRAGGRKAGQEIEDKNLADYKERVAILEKDRADDRAKIAEQNKTIVDQGKQIAHSNGRIDELSKIPLASIDQKLGFLTNDHERFAEHFKIPIERPVRRKTDKNV